SKSTYLWTHGWYGEEGSVKSFIKIAFLSLSTKVLLYGDYSKGLLIQKGFAENKLVPIYNSLDFNIQDIIYRKTDYTNIYKKKFSNDFPVLIYVGRIQKVKRIDQLIMAIKNLNRSGHFCNLVLVG